MGKNKKLTPSRRKTATKLAKRINLENKERKIEAIKQFAAGLRPVNPVAQLTSQDTNESMKSTPTEESIATDVSEKTNDKPLEVKEEN